MSFPLPSHPSIKPFSPGISIDIGIDIAVLIALYLFVYLFIHMSIYLFRKSETPFDQVISRRAWGEHPSNPRPAFFSPFNAPICPSPTPTDGGTRLINQTQRLQTGPFPRYYRVLEVASKSGELDPVPSPRYSRHLGLVLALRPCLTQTYSHSLALPRRIKSPGPFLVACAPSHLACSPRRLPILLRLQIFILRCWISAASRTC
ncbi:hypothetical protein V8C37DRAFT_266222 [Trichoderma ceciliae]